MAAAPARGWLAPDRPPHLLEELIAVSGIAMPVTTHLGNETLFEIDSKG